MYKFPFTTSKEVINSHSPAQISEYGEALEQLRKSGVPGIKKLLGRLETAKKVENFLEYLVEFNIARLLTLQNKTFAYEPVDGDDFVWDDIVFAVKSLQPKEYEKEENEIFERLTQTAQQTGRKASDVLISKDFGSEVTLRATPVNGSISLERIETGKGEPLFSDVKQMGVALSYLADFERKSFNGKKKVIFFFRQAEGFGDYLMEDITLWYFKCPHPHPILGATASYEKMFKTKDGFVKNKGTIDAIVYLVRPAYILTWPKGFAEDEVEIRGKIRKRLSIYPQENELADEIKKIFTY